MNIICDRCRKEIIDASPWPPTTQNPFSCTIAFYDVRQANNAGWSVFARPNEEKICDACMWLDPKYIAIYGVHH